MNMLTGKRILVVEDEPIVAMTLEDMLVDLGCDVIGPASHLPQAIDLAESAAIDGAVLDINLNSGRSYPVADILHRRAVPFLFATGYGEEGVEQRGDTHIPILQKPYRQDQVAAALASLFACTAT